MALTFEWNAKKAAANLRKHKVSFEEARSIFGDRYELMLSDPDHSAEEQRSISIGESETGRLLLVVYVERSDVIRLISSREAEKREAAQYRQRRGDRNA
ncbi:MAG TPA: BrnT family toxin [Acidobacteriaceae bacterium]